MSETRREEPCSSIPPRPPPSPPYEPRPRSCSSIPPRSPPSPPYEPRPRSCSSIPTRSPPSPPYESPLVVSRLSFAYPHNAPVSRSSATTIERFPERLQEAFSPFFTDPIAVSVGPYHHDKLRLEEMEAAKSAALEEFCRVTSQPLEAVRAKIVSLAGDARRCYADDYTLRDMDDGWFADMMLSDGCFLLQFMASMCPDDPNAPPEADPLMSRAEVHTRVDAIARDVLLLENQVPWLVLEALMEFRPQVPVDKFLALMATAFDVGNNPIQQALAGQPEHDQPPPHLLGLFHRRQVGAARTQSLRVPALSSVSSTAVELAEMGVKLIVTKTKKFGDMTMSKRRHRFGLFGELSLAPVVLNDLTECWLLNMAAHEACLGATRADNFAVSSYVSVVALLVNRPEDVQELRGKGIIVSASSDKQTLEFFKDLATELRVGHRYYDVFERLEEYKRERWVWIAVHRFLYKNIKTIIAVLSVVGALAGLFKTILSLKQPQRQSSEPWPFVALFVNCASPANLLSCQFNRRLLYRV
ncbi:UPF0481 protein At3g47200-like [Phragmites australis]|uniref:UPF0481 protein At3g47200-like n=1 Tax=Phragmites australis TaxID=29695 RepID=UPI002D782052|nr:UPF0481 protein At3g47200-like [Phragmites australis]